ncbi:MAG TPA: DcaP family trimeric outer membrane transporter [Rhodocyclaceae bacterium]|nr:DcaP family trimeric outer membrane transporter [Rhodocyclaceae bacterium]
MPISETRRPFAAKVLCAAVAAAVGGFVLPASADTHGEIEALKAQIEALQRSIKALEEKQERTAAAVAPENVVTAGSTKGSFKLPGTDTSVKIGGYVKADLLFSNRSAGANSVADQLLVPSAIPIGSANEKRQTKFHARQTRLNIGTSTPTSWGELRAFVEADFFGAEGNEVVSNSNNLRTRHAYGSLGGLLIGQTWSTFMDAGSLPETLDFGGPVGELFIRQTQVRYTQPFAGGSWAVAIESPESFVHRVGTTDARVSADDDRLPDLVARVDFNTTAGRYAIAGLARNIRVDLPAGGGFAAADDDKWGGALAVYGVIPTVGKDSFNFSLTGGNVLGRYMGQAVFTDAVVDADGSVDLRTQWGAIAAYRHYWREDLRSTLALSYAEASNPSGVASLNRESRTAHLNLLWSPYASTTFGVEYIYGSLERENGAKGSLNRLQASAQYNF